MSLWSAYSLAEPPSDARQRELWVQHAAGFILMHDVRGPGMAVAAEGDGEARRLAERAVDATVYALLQVADGVACGVHNKGWTVDVRLRARLYRGGGAGGPEQPDDMVEDIDLFEGDGCCTGFHGWIEGDYGRNPLFAATPDDHGD